MVLHQLWRKLSYGNLSHIFFNCKINSKLLLVVISMLYQINKKKTGGIIPPCKNLQDFNAFLDNNNLMDVNPINGVFTQTNKRSGFANIVARLDRFLLSKDWQLSCSDISSKILTLAGSDHFPISLNLNCNNNCSDQRFHSSFKFETMWLRHPSFLPNIQQWWNEVPLEGQKMHHFAMKLKYIKS